MSKRITVKDISEVEFLVGSNLTRLIEGNIIYVIARGEQTDEIAKLQREINYELAKRVQRKLHYLVDLNDCGKNSPGARDIWYRLSEDEITGKVAIFGMHPVAKVLAAFVMRISKKKNQRFFRTKKSALQWLKFSL